MYEVRALFFPPIFSLLKPGLPFSLLFQFLCTVYTLILSNLPCYPNPAGLSSTLILPAGFLTSVMCKKDDLLGSQLTARQHLSSVKYG